MPGNDLPARKVTKSDIELQQLIGNQRLRERRLDAATYIVIAILCVLALFPLRPIVESLAGKNTNVNIGVDISIGVSVMLGGTAYVRHRRKDREQSRELQRLRARLEEYDKDLLQ